MDTRDVGDHPAGGGRSHRADHGVQTGGGEELTIGLGANPVVPEEHHRLAALVMADLDESTHSVSHEAVDEVDPRQEKLGGRAEGRVVIAGVDEVLRVDLPAGLGLEGFHERYRNARGVAEPVDELLLGLLIEVEGEMVEEGRETDDVDLWVGVEPLGQGLLDVIPGGRVHDVERMLLAASGIVLPVIRRVVVHLGGVPQLGCQECDGVDVSGRRGHRHDAVGTLATHSPVVDDLAGGAVPYLPPSLDVDICVGANLLSEEPTHDGDLERTVLQGRDSIGTQVQADVLVEMVQGPGLVPTGTETG